MLTLAKERTQVIEKQNRYLFSRNVLALETFFPIAEAFQEKYEPDGSTQTKIIPFKKNSELRDSFPVMLTKIRNSQLSINISITHTHTHQGNVVAHRLDSENSTYAQAFLQAVLFSFLNNNIVNRHFIKFLLPSLHETKITIGM